jgi:hypothetical protein
MGNLSAEEAEELALEAAKLAEMQSDSPIHMTPEETERYDQRRRRISEIYNILARDNSTG